MNKFLLFIETMPLIFFSALSMAMFLIFSIFQYIYIYLIISKEYAELFFMMKSILDYRWNHLIVFLLVYFQLFFGGKY